MQLHHLVTASLLTSPQDKALEAQLSLVLMGNTFQAETILDQGVHSLQCSNPHRAEYTHSIQFHYLTLKPETIGQGQPSKTDIPNGPYSPADDF